MSAAGKRPRTTTDLILRAAPRDDAVSGMTLRRRRCSRTETPMTLKEPADDRPRAYMTLR